MIIENIPTLVSPRGPSSQASIHKKATKGSVIVATPEVQFAQKEHREQGRVKPEVYIAAVPMRYSHQGGRLCED
jgi:hypothetical protein